MKEDATLVGFDASVTLREITKENLRAVLMLDVSEAQREFVAPNSVSIAQAHFEEKAWFRAIYADEAPVGFIMLYDDPDEPSYFLWRLMIDRRYQGRGFGKAAVELLIDYVRTRPGAMELRVSHGEGDGSPEGFYRKLGFDHTGEIEHGELIMRRTL